MSLNIKNINYKDFENICRTCTFKNNLKPIRENQTTIEILHKLGVHFETNDDLPQQICVNCFEKINEIHAFVSKCFETYSNLIKCLNTRFTQEPDAIAETNEFLNNKEEMTIEEHKFEFVPVEENMSESEDSVPSDIEDAANSLPIKSKILYESAYKNFRNWCDLKNVKKVSEKVLLAYFSNKAKVQKPSTIWTLYSMLRTTISINENMDISKFINLIAFLKRNAEGYRPKKSKLFTKNDFSKFLKEADDEIYLLLKVILIIGIVGGCRKDELVRMRTEDVKDSDTYIKISIPNTKTKIQRIFKISAGDIEGINLIEIIRKYVRIRPKHVKNNRFFLGYRNGKCSIQPVGINTFSDSPKRIASFLGLQNPEHYTGHCFRRSSASLLADSDANLLMSKRHGGVAEGYVEESIQNKKKVSGMILEEGNSTNIRMDSHVSHFVKIEVEASTSSGFENAPIFHNVKYENN